MKTQQIHFQFFSLFSQIDDPLTLEEAVKDDVWEQAMDEEIKCTKNNETWRNQMHKEQSNMEIGRCT
jgi:hypothetical protein